MQAQKIECALEVLCARVYPNGIRLAICLGQYLTYFFQESPKANQQTSYRRIGMCNCKILESTTVLHCDANHFV